MDTKEDINNSTEDVEGIVSKDKHNRFKTVINDLLDSFVSMKEDRINSLKDFPIDEVVEWHRAVQKDREEHTKRGHNFNIFNFLERSLKFSIQETKHSSIIKFLLDPKSSHGQGSLFLVEFLKMLKIESPEKGTWVVTAGTEWIDIKLERDKPQSVVIIENKSHWARDSENQLYRYWYEAIYKKSKETSKQFYKDYSHRYQVIYLTPDNSVKYTKQTVTKPIGYNGDNNLPETLPMQVKRFAFNNHIQAWLDNCLAALPATNHRIRELILQYKELCNTL